MTKETTSPKEDERKMICESIRTLEDIMTAVKPIYTVGFSEFTKWEPILSPHNMDEVEDKIMEMVRKLM